MVQRRTIPEDTVPAAQRLQFELWARMSPAEKFAAFEQLMEMAAAVAEAGVRSRYPEASDREVFLRLAARRHDRDTMVRVYGWDPDAHR